MSQNQDHRRRSQNQRPADNTYCRPLPQATEIERAVLGALMIDKDAYDIVCETLTPETFYDRRNQMVYEAIQQLNTKNFPVDVLTVTERLIKNGTLEEVGGPSYVAEVSSRVASSANIEYHSRIIAQKSLARQLIAFAQNIEKKASDETEDVDDTMREADNELFLLLMKKTKRDFRQPFEVVKDASQEMMADTSCPDGVTGVATFNSLDKVTGGFQKEDLIILAGRPSMGKTAFALSCARKMSVDQNIPTAFFTLEMSDVQLMKRLISNVCEIGGSAVNRGQLTQEEWDRFDKRISVLANAPLYLADTPGLSVGDFRAKAKRLVREKGVKAIFIDYLQLMNYHGRRFGTRQEEVAEISKSLKGIAKELKIPIIVLAQMNRGVENREGLEGKRPRLSDLRESGAIEQDADLVIFLYRPEYYGIMTDDRGNSLIGKAELIIAKHRKGATKTAPGLMMTFQKEYTRFDDEENAPF